MFKVMLLESISVSVMMRSSIISTQNITASYICAIKVTIKVNILVNTGINIQELIHVSIFLEQN